MAMEEWLYRALLTTSDGIRGWGFCAGFLMSGDVARFVRLALRRMREAIAKVGFRYAGVALWNAGHEARVHVNAWLVVGLATMLILAGSIIPLASRLSGFSTQHPVFLILILIGWSGLAGAGWIYNISTSTRRNFMVAACAIMFVVMIVAAAKTYGG